jgi:threonine synthase
MDIQVSSNFERLLFEASARDSAEVVRYMSGLRQSGGFAIEAATLQAIRDDFDGGRATETDVAATIARTYERAGYLLDPHTATAVHVAERRLTGSPMIVLGTAHPAKFPDAVERASGVAPALPEWLSGLMDAKETFTVLPSDLKMVEDHISRHARAARQGV